MLKALDNFYEEQEEPNRSCMLALKSIILNYNPDFEAAWKYKLPCFTLNGTIFCYLWKDRKTQMPYISINKGIKIDHPALFLGNRTQFKLLYIDPNKDIPIETIHEIFALALKLYPK